MSAMCGCPREKKIDGFTEWEVKDAASTLERAFEIRQNKKLLRAALRELQKKTDAGTKALKWSSEIK